VISTINYIGRGSELWGNINLVDRQVPVYQAPSVHLSRAKLTTRFDDRYSVAKFSKSYPRGQAMQWCTSQWRAESTVFLRLQRPAGIHKWSKSPRGGLGWTYPANFLIGQSVFCKTDADPLSSHEAWCLPTPHIYLEPRDHRAYCVILIFYLYTDIFTYLPTRPLETAHTSLATAIFAKFFDLATPLSPVATVDIYQPKWLQSFCHN